MDFRVLALDHSKAFELKSSWQKKNPIHQSHLRQVRVLHYGFDHQIHHGDLVVHKKVADEVLEIFQKLFKWRYCIEKIKPIDRYQANDEKSCSDNNTSAFCSRAITGIKNQWSDHSYGLAIDLNPLYNPYHRNKTIVPKEGRQYLDRNQDCPHILKSQDPCVALFKSYGWKWGGDWMKERGYVDYQHFYKELENVNYWYSYDFLR